jgi:hypothetical protein
MVVGPTREHEAPGEDLEESHTSAPDIDGGIERQAAKDDFWGSVEWTHQMFGLGLEYLFRSQARAKVAKLDPTCVH